MAATLAASLMGAPAVATTHPTEELVAEIESRGVPVAFHGPECSQGFNGVYYPTANEMVVCSPLPPHMMSNETKETLYHETVHMIQDCHGGGLHTSDLAYLVDNAQLSQLIAMSGIDPEAIADAYREHMNATDHVIRLELEAWAMQELVTEELLIEALEQVCG